MVRVILLAMPHVIVDNIPSDPWAITAAIAALVAAAVGIWALFVAISALKATKKELQLADSQLTATQEATRQTQAALDLGQEQLRTMQKAELNRIRELAPHVTATMKWDARFSGHVMYIRNVGGSVAKHLLVTGFDPNGKPHRVDIGFLDRGEERRVDDFFSRQVQYCKDIRIRAFDVYGHKYITEYRNLSSTLGYDVFRQPWLDENIEDRPKRCSDEVSWEVESFERAPGLEPEPAEEGFNVDEPA